MRLLGYFPFECASILILLPIKKASLPTNFGKGLPLPRCSSLALRRRSLETNETLSRVRAHMQHRCESSERDDAGPGCTCTQPK